MTPALPLRTGLRLLAAWLLLGTLPVRAQDVPLTLSAAISEALRSRPLLAGGAERVAAARARITQARAALLPRVDVQGTATDGPTGAPAMFVGGLAGTPLKRHTGASLNLVQTLLDFGRTHNLVRARRAEAESAALLLEADRLRVELEVRQAFLQVVQARRLEIVSRQVLESRELLVRQAETFRQQGLGTRLDVDLANLAAAQARLAIVRAGADAEVAVAALGAALGRDLSPTAALADPVLGGAPAEPAAPAAPDAAALVAAALRDRPELRQAETQVRASQHLTAAARAGGRPLLTGVGSVGKINPSPLIAATDKPWAVGLALTIPLFTGRLVESQTEEARRTEAAARENRRELELQIRRQVTSAAAQLRAAEESVRVARSQLVQAEDALRLAAERYRAQLGSIVEVSQAQAGEATARDDLVRSLYDRELTRAALDYAVGKRA